MSGGKECSFFGKFGVLCFLVTPVFSYAFLVSPVLPTNVPIYVTEAQRICNYLGFNIRGGSRTAATSKMEHFVIIVNGFQP